MRDPSRLLLAQTTPAQTQTRAHTQRAQGQRCDLSRVWPVWVKQAKSSWTQMSSWLLKPYSLTFFSPLLSTTRVPSLKPLWRLSDNQRGREEEGSGGKEGRRVVRARCDVPTQGYLILSVRGERLSPSVWFWEIKDTVEILARWLALSSWVDQSPFLAVLHAYTQILRVTGEDVAMSVMRQWLMDLCFSTVLS